MTIKETWEKYKHLDEILCNQVAMGDNQKAEILCVLWLAIKAHKDDEGELVRLRKIADAAEASVRNPAWAGICDEDVALESALKEGGYLKC